MIKQLLMALVMVGLVCSVSFAADTNKYEQDQFQTFDYDKQPQHKRVVVIGGQSGMEARGNMNTRALYTNYGRNYIGSRGRLWRDRNPYRTFVFPCRSCN
jgi:hypothetical protein